MTIGEMGLPSSTSSGFWVIMELPHVSSRAAMIEH